MNIVGNILNGLFGGKPIDSSLAGIVGNLFAGQPGGGVAGGLFGGRRDGGVLGGLLGGGHTAQEPVQQPDPGAAGTGGLTGLLGRFQQAGLGHVTDSWVGTGSNQPVSPQQLEQVLGQQQVQQMAQQANMHPQDLLSQLSQILPQVVDRLTPNGQLPPADAFGGGQTGGFQDAPFTGGGKVHRT